MSGRPLRVVGLDLSIRSTGMSDGQTVHAVRPSTSVSMEDRILEAKTRCLDFVHNPSRWDHWSEEDENTADLVVIEGAAYAAKGNAADELAGLRWAVRISLAVRRIPFAIVTPKSLKLYTAGTGTASKTEMVAALATRHGLDLSMHKVTHGRHDMADAYALAAMGYHWFHQPLTARTELPERPELTFPARAAEDMIPLSVGSPLR